MFFVKLVSLAGIAVLFLSTLLCAHEYLYPIDSLMLDDKEYVCVIHQTNTHNDVSAHLTMFLWDPVTKLAYKACSAFYNPAGVCVLPNKQEFSFIHNDALYIKHTQARQARIIPFLGPYSLSRVSWLDNTTCYFSARYGEYFHILQGNREGDVLCLTACLAEPHVDYLFPQKVGRSLFFIKRDAQKKYALVKIDYDDLFKEAGKTLNIKSDAHCVRQDVLYVHDGEYKFPEIGFLHMKNEKEGYFLTLPRDDQSNQALLISELFIIEKSDNLTSWNVSCSVCLSFDKALITPLDFQINGEAFGLYESIYPLLPKYQGNDLYFASLGNGHSSLYQLNKEKSYSVVGGDKKEYTYLSIYFYQGTMYYGGQINKVTTDLFCDDENQWHIDLPCIDIR